MISLISPPRQRYIEASWKFLYPRRTKLVGLAEKGSAAVTKFVAQLSVVVVFFLFVWCFFFACLATVKLKKKIHKPINMDYRICLKTMSFFLFRFGFIELLSSV